MAISNMGRALGASLLGPLKEAFAWEYVFLIVGLFALVSLLFIMVLRMKEHLDRLDCMEADEAEKDYQKLSLVV
jgi:PAT family beta-lactamase induction signal transducer AmpG